LGADVSFLILEKLTKRFGTHLAVDGLSLGVEKGEFVSLLGPSGCGKTTTLQMIAGFVEPTAGAITLEGRDLLAVKPAKRGLGIVFQSYALFPHMTVAETWRSASKCRAWPRWSAPGGSARRWNWWDWPPSAAASRASSRAASNKGWRLPARSSSGRRSCCSMSR
jgi:ABC-type sugar transport system ATPase subunit